MRVLGRGAAIAASFVILSSPPVLQRLVGGDTRAYLTTPRSLREVEAEAVAQLLERNGFEGIRSHPDLSGKPRVTLGTVHSQH